MNKAQVKLIQRAWMMFDRSTALGCVQSNKQYNKEYCKALWNNYNRVLIKNNIPPIIHNSPFI